MTRPAHEFELVRFYIDWGLNNCEIERLTGISRSSVRTWRQRVSQGLTNASLQQAGESACPICSRTTLNEPAYAYLLGTYLGDGHIARCPKDVYRLTVVQDQKYIGLISECDAAISSLIEGHPLHVGFQQCEGCVHINSHWKHWPCVFPQHGPGPKHKRAIVLSDWQERIVKRHPGLLIRGLIHSDGCRGTNRVRRPVAGEMKYYSYPRYQFSNESSDIKAIFCGACDLLGIQWRRMNRKTISIARKEEVAKMDLIVGPKY